MPALLAHINLVKEIVKENPKLFSSADLKFLIQGATYPDIYYITGIRTITKKPNFSKYIHEADNELVFSRMLLKNARNKKERLFAIGFLSHMLLDKNVHGYLKSVDIYADIRHIISEYYLETKFKASKIPTPEIPILLLKETLNEYSKNEYVVYKNKIKLSIRALTFYEFVNKLIINKIINKKYRLKSKKKWSIINIPFKLARISKYTKIGYNYLDLLNPDEEIKEKYLEPLYSEYKKTKKELINIVMEKELNVVNYVTRQTEIREFV